MKMRIFNNFILWKIKRKVCWSYLTRGSTERKEKKKKEKKSKEEGEENDVADIFILVESDIYSGDASRRSAAGHRRNR